MDRARPIRVLMAKPGLDGHDVGAKLVCRALMDAGMEVIYTGLRQSPALIAQVTSDEGVDVLGLSVLSGAHLPLCRQVAVHLEALGGHDVLWIVGGNIPLQDHAALRELGIEGIFPTGASFEEIVEFIQRNTRGRAPKAAEREVRS
jgi:methylmalonyl-CoA mutase C-terminal domain/subunit